MNNESGFIDQTARRKPAEAVRHFGTGQTTNDAFQDSIPASKEWALHDIQLFGIWPLYDDLSTHKLTGSWAPTPAGKKLLTRIILFLKSNQPYRYDRKTGQWGRFLAMFFGFTTALSLAGNPFLFSTATSLLVIVAVEYVWTQINLKRCMDGRRDLWPFFCEADYQAALSEPVYLSGRSRGQ